MVTVYDVARAAGVSIASVSRALNGQRGVSSATAERVRELAVELGYSPNEIARSLVAKYTRTIALLLPDITNPFFPELVKGVQTAAELREHALLLADSSDRPEKILRDIEVLRRKQVDGLILISQNADYQDIAEACHGLPVVALDRDLDIPGASTIGVDHEQGAYTAVRHLLDLGHTRIAHIAGPSRVAVSARRRAGWERALREAGLVPDEALVVEGTFLEDGGYAAGAALLEHVQDFTAVFAANDLTALGLLAACAEAGVSVPGDLSVVGFDGIHLARYTTPRLTTVAQPIYDLGRRAGEVLIDAIGVEEPPTVVEMLDTHLVLGGSTGAPRGAA